MKNGAVLNGRDVGKDMYSDSLIKGVWETASKPETGLEAVRECLADINNDYFLIEKDGGYAMVRKGKLNPGEESGGYRYPVSAYIPACPVERLGDEGFLSDYRVKYPLYAGSMAHGINSEEIVVQSARNGILAFYGSAGMSPDRIESIIDRTKNTLGDLPFGFNLINSPGETGLEAELVDLYIKKGIRLIEASAYMNLSMPLVRFRLHDIYRDAEGRVVAPNRIIAKISRVEIAGRFMSPPPENLVKELLQRGDITAEQADMAKEIPLATDITAEADSGGHTDGRPAITLFPTIISLRDRLQEQFGYRDKIRVGAAGGISTPFSAQSAFSMGVAYVVTGSVNQACVESGTSDLVRQLLAEAQQADVALAPSADMFELGAKVQVLKRGTMFAMRAGKLYDLYRNYSDFRQIPEADRSNIEKNFFKCSFDEVWNGTCDYFRDRDPAQIEKGNVSPKHKMALVFRWYLGQASHWAISGEPSRKVDFQIWCGPSMGAFNEWVRGTFLEKPEERSFLTVNLNILHGAGYLSRLNMLKVQGIDLFRHIPPRPIGLNKMKEIMGI